MWQHTPENNLQQLDNFLLTTLWKKTGKIGKCHQPYPLINKSNKSTCWIKILLLDPEDFKINPHLKTFIFNNPELLNSKSLRWSWTNKVHHRSLAFSRLIGESVSNSLIFYGLASHYITNWRPLNASIQTELTETGTPCHSPTFTRNHLGGGFPPVSSVPLDTASCLLQGNQPLGFSIQTKHEAHLISQEPTIFHN